MILNRRSGEISHRHFGDFPEFLQAGDLLVLNRTRVIKARFIGRKSDTGAKVEILVTRKLDGNGGGRWLALVKPGKKLKKGVEVVLEPNRSSEVSGYMEPNGTLGEAKVLIEENRGMGISIVVFGKHDSETELFEKYGAVPLPPYIKRAPGEDDAGRYQTVYAEEKGSVAAATAGLHFTDEMLERIKERGVDIGYLTLHVGPGTFRPVAAEDVVSHRMDEEWYELPAKLVKQYEHCRSKGGNVIAVGTTSVRCLESSVAADGNSAGLIPGTGWTDLFIYPSFKFKIVDRLLTNFHLPKSSLLMLVSAFADRKTVLNAYEEAVRKKYRFYSYGDAMLVL